MSEIEQETEQLQCMLERFRGQATVCNQVSRIKKALAWWSQYNPELTIPDDKPLSTTTMEPLGLSLKEQFDATYMSDIAIITYTRKALQAEPPPSVGL